MFLDRLEELAAALTAAGVRAAVDPRDIQPPAVWVTLAAVDPAAHLCGDTDITAELMLIGRDTGHRAALAQLETLLTAVASVVDIDGPALPNSVTMPSGGGPLPALSVTTQPL